MDRLSPSFPGSFYLRIVTFMYRPYQQISTFLIEDWLIALSEI